MKSILHVTELRKPVAILLAVIMLLAAVPIMMLVPMI